MKVLLTGATGFIGRELGKALVCKGHQVVALSRNQKKARLELPFPCEILEADGTNRSPISSLFPDVEAVIHLAGENVGEGRWTPERKKKILSSRTDFTRHLIEGLPGTCRVFISASAIGYYGDRGDEILTETSSRGSGFLADVCEQWESMVWKGKEKAPQARFVALRTGVVFAPYGGALLKMLTPFQMGVGGVLGSGQQWTSWIHLQDLVQMYLTALEDSSWSGPINALAPEPVTNARFTETLTRALGVRKGPAVPAFALKALYGEMASVILNSQRVKSDRVFSFRYPTLEEALLGCVEPYQGGKSVFHAEQYFPLPRSQVFPFFATAQNLEAITPEFLKFKVEKMSTAQIENGTLIDYQLRIHGVHAKWRTLIEEWVPQERFVDTQLKGPYREWRHSHRFEDLEGGTLMTDTVCFQVPFGHIGRAVSGAFVRGNLEKIFAHRKKTVLELLRRKD